MHGCLSIASSIAHNHDGISYARRTATLSVISYWSRDADAGLIRSPTALTRVSAVRKPVPEPWGTQQGCGSGCLRRSLTSLAWAGAVSAFLAAGFCALAALLAVQAGLKGRIGLGSISLLPNPDLNGPGWLNQALGVISTLPVIALAFVCHYNVHPLVGLGFMNSHARSVHPRSVAPAQCLHLRHPAHVEGQAVGLCGCELGQPF